MVKRLLGIQCSCCKSQSLQQRLTSRLIYVVSPADLLPGPVDDVIAILLYLAANKRDLRIIKKNDEATVIDVDGREI